MGSLVGKRFLFAVIIVVLSGALTAFSCYLIRGSLTPEIALDILKWFFGNCLAVGGTFLALQTITDYRGVTHSERKTKTKEA